MGFRIFMSFSSFYSIDPNFHHKNHQLPAPARYVENVHCMQLKSLENLSKKKTGAKPFTVVASTKVVSQC